MLSKPTYVITTQENSFKVRLSYVRTVLNMFMGKEGPRAGSALTHMGERIPDRAKSLQGKKGMRSTHGWKLKPYRRGGALVPPKKQRKMYRNVEMRKRILLDDLNIFSEVGGSHLLPVSGEAQGFGWSGMVWKCGK